MNLSIDKNNLLTLGTFALSVFLTGSFFGGDWRYRNELKQEIKEIKAEQAAVLQQVQQENEKYKRQQLEFEKKTLEFYKTLDAITDQKKNVATELKKLEPVITAQKEQLKLDIAVLESLLGNPIELKK
jgi:hypothetical protein